LTAYNISNICKVYCWSKVKIIFEEIVDFLFNFADLISFFLNVKLPLNLLLNFQIDQKN
jgi:hypothetical protein